MSISEMLEFIGNENVGVQMLAPAMTGISTGKKYSKVTFGTNAINATNVANDTGPVGMILWLPRDRFEEATKQAKHDEQLALAKRTAPSLSGAQHTKTQTTKVKHSV